MEERRLAKLELNLRVLDPATANEEKMVRGGQHGGESHREEVPRRKRTLSQAPSPPSPAIFHFPSAAPPVHVHPHVPQVTLLVPTLLDASGYLRLQQAVSGHTMHQGEWVGGRLFSAASRPPRWGRGRGSLPGSL